MGKVKVRRHTNLRYYTRTCTKDRCSGSFSAKLSKVLFSKCFLNLDAFENNTHLDRLNHTVQPAENCLFLSNSWCPREKRPWE